MQFKTHLAFAFLISLILIDSFGIANQILFTITVLFSAILPDLDKYNSIISKKLRPASFITSLLFKHRGLFHSLFFPIILPLILYLIDQKMIAFAVLTGYTSHLILDAITINGITPLYPIFSKKLKGFIKVSSLLDHLLFYIFVILSILKLMNFI